VATARLRRRSFRYDTDLQRLRRLDVASGKGVVHAGALDDAASVDERGDFVDSGLIEMASGSAKIDSPLIPAAEVL
jgi:hypothetical protein